MHTESKRKGAAARLAQRLAAARNASEEAMRAAGMAEQEITLNLAKVWIDRREVGATKFSTTVVRDNIPSYTLLMSLIVDT